MKKLLFPAALLVATPALAQNAASGSSRVQGVPDGYGDPVQVTIVASDGSDVSGTNTDTAALITAAGATTSQTGADQTNREGRCVTVILDMTTVGTGSVTLTIQGKDAASGKYYTLLAGAAVTTNSTNPYWVCPGAATTANVSAALPLPRTWRVITTANNANATTYKVGASVTN